MQEGTQIGDYALVRRLSIGRVTSTWLARHTVLESEHHLRVLLPQWATVPELVEAFLASARAQLALRHPGLPRVTDALQGAIVSDPVEGLSLRERLDTEGWLAPKEAVSIAVQVLEVLAYAHEHGVFHGRLDPDRIVIANGQVHVLGFGEDLPGVDPPVSMVKGQAITYLAPERVDGAAASRATDVFSVGAILWELLAGRPPFAGATAFVALGQAREGNPRSPDRHGEVPSWLEDAIDAALAPRRRRFQDAHSFQKVLEAGPRGANLPNDPRPDPVDERSQRNLLWMAGLGFGGIALAAMAGTGLLGLAFWTMRPASVHKLDVTSDACGLVTIEADVDGSGATELMVDGAIVYTEPTHTGRRTVQHTIQRAQGTSLLVEAQVGSATQVQHHTVDGEPLTLEFVVGGHPRAGQVGTTRVWLRGSCVPDGLTWHATVPGHPPRSGRVDALPAEARAIELDTTHLGMGRHQVAVELRSGTRVVQAGSATVLVGEAPPPDDQDLDGYPTDQDCNDADPSVNPGQPELGVPNGVDDDCDGQVDEGTAAYDDDGDGASEEQGDCDDGDPAVGPAASEVGNCRDDDCDGTIDEGVTLLQVDDAYEPNDDRSRPYDLATQGQRTFHQELALIASGPDDAAWFRFYSQDGDFDEWGIDVSIPEMPPQSRYRVEVYDDQGQVRASLPITARDQTVKVRGKAFQDDSGDYLVFVRPEAVYADWCPYRLAITSR